MEPDTKEFDYNVRIQKSGGGYLLHFESESGVGNQTVALTEAELLSVAKVTTDAVEEGIHAQSRQG